MPVLFRSISKLDLRIENISPGWLQYSRLVQFGRALGACFAIST